MTRTATPEALHRRALAYNWDSGPARARGIALHPDCDRATALLIYWRLSPHYYRRFASVAESPERVRAGAALAREVEQRLLSGEFRTSLFSYDPADDDGIDRTRASDNDERCAVRPIPAELYRACGPPRAGVETDIGRLERGCRSGDVDEVDLALANGDWNRLSPSEKRTLLGVAVQWDHLAVVERLLAAGASVKFTRGHRTLLDDAAGVAMIDLLVGHGADPKKATLALAVAKGSAAIRRLVELETPINALSRWGEPAIYRAAVDGHLDVLATLIELGADRGIPRESDGRTALEAVDERLDALRSFLEAGAPYDCPERAEFGVLTSARIALTGDRRLEDSRYW